MLYKKDSLKGKAKSITVVLLISRLSFILSSGSFISLILNVSHFSLKAWCSLFFRHWPIPMPTASLTTLYSRASWNCCVATLFLQYFVIKNATESKTIISHKHYIYAQTLQPAYLINMPTAIVVFLFSIRKPEFIRFQWENKKLWPQTKEQFVKYLSKTTHHPIYNTCTISSTCFRKAIK